MFAELHCVSNYSFLRGASHPAELVARAHELGYQAIAITDECSYAGIVKAYVAARDLAIDLIVGSEFWLDTTTEEKNCHVVLLAPNLTAYREISLLITRARRRSPKGHYQLDLEELRFGTQHCLAIWLPQFTHRENSTQGALLKQFFKDRLWLGVELLQEGGDSGHLEQCFETAKMLNISMVACNDVHMHAAIRQPLQDILTATRHNTNIYDLGRRRFRNGERHLRPIEKLQKIYPEALLVESLHIAELCDFSLDELRHNYPKELVPEALNAIDYLRTLSREGALKRWPEGVPDEVNQQLEYELSLIEELEYEHYFLTVHDVVRFAREQQILCQGRGSAANSAVCYCLFITEVDPSQSSLLFERFISKERNEPPDIDVDFEHERREEVIQYIYQKYTRKRAALTATVITYRVRSAIRDVGKALGLNPTLLSRLSNNLAWWDKPHLLQERLKEVNLDPNGVIAQQFLVLIQSILGFPRHLSQHVGGFLITESPISTIVPVENASMPERTIIQWDKEDIEALGLLKVDVLALGMLSAIRKSLAMINTHHKIPLTYSSIPKEDSATYDMLCTGDSVGVFQVESRAQMSMLPRLKPRCYYDLVIEVAIVRPGPIQGDMVHPYLKRRNGEEPIHYEHPDIETVLERTLGIPLFQEQVIKLAMVAAGFSGGEADQLRRAMASWGKNGNLIHFKEKLIDGMTARGYSLDFAERLFRQMKGFGEYGFPESHAASFALLVYVSAWLKCHYPAAFYCGILNSLPMGFYSASQLLQDAARHHVPLQPIDILHSHWDHTLETNRDGNTRIRLGMRLIKGLKKAIAEQIIRSRKEISPTSVHPISVQQLLTTAQLHRNDRTRLADAGALQSLTKNRYDAHWQIQHLKGEDSLPLENPTNTLPEHIPEPTDIDNMLTDYRTTRVSIEHHPMALLRSQPEFQRCQRASDLSHIPHGRFVRIAGLVTGRQRPGTASGVLFMTVEDETGNINVVIWKSLQERQRQQVLNAQIVLIKGILETDNNVIHVIAGDIEDCSHLLPEFKRRSRDFR